MIDHHIMKLVCMCLMSVCIYQTVLFPGLWELGSLSVTGHQRLHIFYGWVISHLSLERQLECRH